MDQDIRRTVAIRRETADDNRSDFAAGTLGGYGSSTGSGRRRARKRIRWRR